jgi:hypothetical protein
MRKNKVRIVIGKMRTYQIFLEILTIHRQAHRAFGIENINLGDLERKGIGHHTSLAFLFKKDNMLLSLAQKIFEAFGCKLTILLKDKAEEKKEGIPLSNEAELVSLYSQGSRLGFLDMYMRMHKLTQRKVAAELGKSPGTVSYWFRTDDIYIANLKEFADAFGARLVVEFIEG